MKHATLDDLPLALPALNNLWKTQHKGDQVQLSNHSDGDCSGIGWHTSVKQSPTQMQVNRHLLIRAWLE